MTDSQIIKIASQHLTAGTHTDTGWIDTPEWSSDEKNLLRFARVIYSEGLRDGYDDGYTEGVHDGGQ
jgi:hypothetical protein